MRLSRHDFMLHLGISLAFLQNTVPRYHIFQKRPRQAQTRPMKISGTNRELSISTVVHFDRKIVRPPVTNECDAKGCALDSMIRQAPSASLGIPRLQMHIADTPRENVGFPSDSHGCRTPSACVILFSILPAGWQLLCWMPYLGNLLGVEEISLLDFALDVLLGFVQLRASLPAPSKTRIPTKARWVRGRGDVR